MWFYLFRWYCSFHGYAEELALRHVECSLWNLIPKVMLAWSFVIAISYSIWFLRVYVVKNHSTIPHWRPTLAKVRSLALKSGWCWGAWGKIPFSLFPESERNSKRAFSFPFFICPRTHKSLWFSFMRTTHYPIFPVQ